MKLENIRNMKKTYFTFLKRLYNFFWSMYKIQNILNFPKSCCQINFKIHKINFPLYFIFLQQLRVALTWQLFNPAVLGCCNVCCNVMVFHHETYSEAMSHLKTLCIGIKSVYKNNFSGRWYEKKVPQPITEISRPKCCSSRAGGVFHSLKK